MAPISLRWDSFCRNEQQVQWLPVIALIDGGFFMRFKNLDLIIAMFIVGLNVAWTQIPNSLMIVGIVLALPLVLFLPGYALIQTLFRRRLPEQLTVSGMVARPQNLKIGHPIGSADQLVLSLGLSMAIDVPDAGVCVPDGSGGIAGRIPVVADRSHL